MFNPDMNFVLRVALVRGMTRQYCSSRDECDRVSQHHYLGLYNSYRCQTVVRQLVVVVICYYWHFFVVVKSCNYDKKIFFFA